MPFIRRVRVESPGLRSEHITAVQYSGSASGPLTVASTEAIARVIDGGTTMYTRHDQTGERALVITRTSPAGRRHLTTVANGRETDNLLRLPRF
ncbi:DUF3892 domain-containing protein [Agromyces sp. M3QZ16-3]|uniref:DUF3892 domain-containing protein n=1 Tax=Agromyces sp. M3QZ16-3 TaxID=3447585 RepID=UPI003F6945F3